VPKFSYGYDILKKNVVKWVDGCHPFLTCRDNLSKYLDVHEIGGTVSALGFILHIKKKLFSSSQIAKFPLPTPKYDDALFS
jgi:hypothetical protein